MLKEAARARVLSAIARTVRRPAPSTSDRVLILQPDHLGDILLSEPAVRLLREALPSTELVAVVGPWSSEICRMAWPVDDVLEVAFPGFDRGSANGGPMEPYSYLDRQSRLLRTLGARDAIVIRDDAWWAAWLAKSSVGGQVVAADDPRTRNFATVVSQAPNYPHRTRIAAEIVRTYLGERSQNEDLIDWDMSPRLSGRVDATSFSQAQENTRPLMVIHPGSGAPVKSWPVRNWRVVVKHFSEFDVVLTGSKSECSECVAIAEGFAHARVVAGVTSLPELIRLLHGSRIALGADNGPMHLAGALGTPTVRLFGPTNPDRYGPYPGSTNQVVISAGWTCRRCEDLSLDRAPGCGCMLAIDPLEVIEHAVGLLDVHV